ncbi:MAG: diguanylate cyclase, partial [Acidobacteria bacterium]|nr:diguanylate cyclase [Acidobacteriota bacterium]
LAKLPEHRYDAILCDMWMGEMSGKEFYLQVKTEFPEYQRRIIFVTGDLASEATWDFIDERKLPYLLKPFSRNELQRKLRKVIGELPAAPQPAEIAPPVWDGSERRRHRRFTTRTSVSIRRKRWAVGQPDIGTAVNASREGVFFLSDHAYRVGTEVWAAFPYTGRNDLEQEGFVVRVEELPEGQWGIAIALGEAAEAARIKFECSGTDARRHHILLQTADRPSADPVQATKTSAAEEEARRLAEELVELKTTHDRVLDQRDRLAMEEAALKKQLSELDAARSAMTEALDELKGQMDGLQKDVAAGEGYRYRATHDSLTGLWNRAAILDFLKREMIRSQREGTPIGVLLADLDHFKNINDTYGHLAGDAVLREVAQRICAGVREYDAVGRYGGEEFLIVLTACEEEPTKHAERIRMLINADPIETAEGAIPVTLSLGAAWNREFSQDLEALLKTADTALYRAKRAGRNQVAVAGDPGTT